MAIPDSFYDQDVETSQGDDADPSDAGVTDNTPEDDDSTVVKAVISAFFLIVSILA